MSELASWASLGATALTATTAILALSIAARQSRTSKRQLDVDLYHLRVGIFEKISSTEAQMNFGPGLAPFIDDLKGLVQRTAHLFGPNAKWDLARLIDALIDFDVHRAHGEPDDRPTFLERVHEIRRLKQKLVNTMNPRVNLHEMDGSAHPLAWIDDALDRFERKQG